MKMIQRKEVALCIILTIVTCGLYGIYWMYTLTEDLNAIVPEQTATPGANVILFTILTCGIYGVYWLYVQGEKIDYVKRQRGLSSSYTGLVYIVFAFLGVGIISHALMQNEINNLL